MSKESDSEPARKRTGDDKEVDWIDSDEDKEKKDDTDNDKSINLKITDDDETDDEFIEGVEQVYDDEDEEMTSPEVEESRNSDEENTDAAKTDAGKTKEVKDDAKKVELPLTSSSLSVSLAPIPTPPIITDASTITTDVLESDALSVIQLRVKNFEKNVSELKKIDHSAKAIATLKSQVLMVIEQYLVFKIGDALQKICKIKREQAEKQKMQKSTIKSTNKAALKEYDLKNSLYQTMHENKSFNRNLTNHVLYHALVKALIENENAMDKGVVDTVKNHKRQHDDDDDDPSAGPNQGSKTGKFASAKEPVEEPISKVVMDDVVYTTGEDVVHDDDQPQDTLEPKRTRLQTKIVLVLIRLISFPGYGVLCLTFGSDDEEYATTVRDFKKFFRRRGRFVRQPQNNKNCSKEAELTRTVNVIENVLDSAIQIILLENVQTHQKTRTKERSSKVLGVIAVKKIIRRSKIRRVSQLKHQMRNVSNPLTLVMKTHQ
nr:hypothetical protein [Tanacetum cinerariifolium]